MSTTELDRSQLIEQLNEIIPLVGKANVLLSNAIAQQFGMNANDLDCVHVLSREGPMTAGELARHCGMTSGGLTGLVDRLVEHGLAKRQPDENDRRRVLISSSITPEVIDKICNFYAPLQALLDEFITQSTDDQLSLLVRFHQMVADKMFQLTHEISQLHLTPSQQ